jgi:hypothetical protein
MLKTLKSKIKRPFNRLAARGAKIVTNSLHLRGNVFGLMQANTILLLRSEFRADPSSYHLGLKNFGFRVHSEFEEDGQLIYIFAAIGFGNKIVVEIGAGDGIACMSANLIVNHGFTGLLFDSDPDNVNRGTEFFAQHRDTSLIPPKFERAWITAENVNEFISGAGVSGDVDLLALDIDGNDYWVWKAIEVIDPRVCVFETHDIIPSDLALTVPYDPNFAYEKQVGGQKEFRSASLKAMCKLCAEKGYRLIGSHRYGFNVYFLRNDVGEDIFPEVTIEEVHNNPWTRYGQKERWPLVKDMPWVLV